MALFGALFALALLPVVLRGDLGFDFSFQQQPASRLTRIVKLKQGELRGIVRDFRNRDLRDVELYLGIPYAEPPVGEFRLMPSGRAPPWYGVKRCTKLGPVCPQKLPDIARMSPQRKESFKRLLHHLKDQDEDCLYLNLYVPTQEPGRAPRKFPVIVFIHGESYEWNSGNAYDGSVLASYGEVIVVTFNFRLGILGFLKAGLGQQAYANFGLVDQVAALLWVNENIAAFGGDPGSITVMGHSTGAACVNFLMVSTTASGLFQKAIMMSGSALSDWALNTNPLQVTTQVAERLNCPLEDGKLAPCLRRKRLSDIMAVDVVTPEYVTKFGPVVDGLVVPNEPRHLMEVYTNMFSNYDLLYGVAELESVHLLSGIHLIHGMLENERDEALRSYLQARFQYNPDAALASTLREYTPLLRSSALDHRDHALDVLSDARVTAPIIQTANFHSRVNPKSYLYVFGHNTTSRERTTNKSEYGDELPYIFGAPLEGPISPFDGRFSPEEILFSEAIMTFWVNFAQTGNPNAPKRGGFRSLGTAEWKYYDIDWPEYENKSQLYMRLAIPPSIGSHYRFQLMNYWNKFLPEILSNQTSKAYFPRTPRPLRPFNYPPFLVPTRPSSSRSSAMDEIRKMLQENDAPVRTEHDRVYPVKDDTDKEGTVVTAEPEPEKSSAYNLVLILGSIFLLINVFAFAALFYKRNRLAMKERSLQQRLEDTNNESQVQNSEKLIINAGTDDQRKGCSVLDIIRKPSKSEDTYEAVKVNDYESGQKRKLARQTSSSTIDAHTKVRNWISQEIVHKYSPKFLRRARPESSGHRLKKEAKIGSASSLGQSPTRPASPKKTDKVSVAVDATPAARSSSVLRQQPIELTKSLDCSRAGHGDATASLRRTKTVDNLPGEGPADEEPIIIKIGHSHSKSDPVPKGLFDSEPQCTLQTFSNVNVTSRDDNAEPSAPLSPEDALRTIQRRNFPKVLPDFPNEDIYAAYKRRSLPPGVLLSQMGNYGFDLGLKAPPAPPPRTCSTLGRKPSNANRMDSFPRIATEPPLPEEPIITTNTLVIGPLVPSKESEPKATHIDTKGRARPEELAQSDEKKSRANMVRGNPKVIIKPTYSKSRSTSKDGKAIPRVASENSPYGSIDFSRKNKPSANQTIKHQQQQQPQQNFNEVPKSDGGSMPNVSGYKSRIPTLSKTNAFDRKPSSSDSSNSISDCTSDTGTVVKRE